MHNVPPGISFHEFVASGVKLEVLMMRALLFPPRRQL